MDRDGIFEGVCERECVEGDFDGVGVGERTGDLRGGGAGVRGDL